MVRYTSLFAMTIIALQAGCGSALRGSVTEVVEEKGLQSVRIVGGQPSSFNDFPFFVDLLVCGASLIWEDLVLTAAHCNINLTNGYIGPNQEQRSIVWGTVHPNYVEGTSNSTDFVDFDFMVLVLDSPVLEVPIIELNSHDDKPAIGAQLQVIGLGLTSENGTNSDGLLKVTLDYIENPECNELYEGVISDSMMCAGVEGGGKDSCHGDSGGPVFIGNMQFGVVSFGDGCGRADKPGVYGRVSAAYDWIQTMICCLSSNPPLACGIVNASACPNDLFYGSEWGEVVWGNFTGGGVLPDDDSWTNLTFTLESESGK